MKPIHEKLGERRKIYYMEPQETDCRKNRALTVTDVRNVKHNGKRQKTFRYPNVYSYISNCDLACGNHKRFCREINCEKIRSCSVF